MLVRSESAIFAEIFIILGGILSEPCKFCSISGHFSLDFIAMFSLVRQPVSGRNGLAVFQNVLLLTNAFLEISEK